MTRRLTRQELAMLKDDIGAALPPPVPRKKRKNEESVMQRALVKWFDHNAAKLGVHPLCLMSIPNGGNGDARRGSIMKAEGQRKGAPDMFLAARVRMPLVHTALTGGLFLELKTPKGTLSPEQEVYHEILRNQGYRVVVIRSLFDGINEITSYLTVGIRDARSPDSSLT